MHCFCFEEGLQCLVQVNKIRVAFVKDPRVGGLKLRVAAVWTWNTPIRRVLLTLTISHLNLKLDIISDIAVLPHEEFHCHWVLPSQ